MAFPKLFFLSQSVISVLLIPKILLLVKQIRSRTSQINNLRTSIPILLQPRTLETIESITDPFSAAHDTFVLVVSKGTFVADSNKSCWTDVGIAYGTFTVAFVAESTDGYAGDLATHY